MISDQIISSGGQDHRPYFGYETSGSSGTASITPEFVRAESDIEHRRLSYLYEVSKILSQTIDIDEIYSKLLVFVTELLPMLSAVLIYERDSRPRSIIWTNLALTEKQLSKSVDKATLCFEYLVNCKPINEIFLKSRRDHAEQKPLSGREIDLTEDLDPENYLIFPIVVDRSSIFGVLQFQGLHPLLESEVKFANAIANLVSAALDRIRRGDVEKADTLSKFEESVTKLDDAEGRVLGLEAERDLRETFVATLSHDLRNPLAAVKLIAEMIRRNPENYVRLANRIIDNISRADEMVQDILNVKRIQAGQKLPMTIASMDLSELVRSTLRDLVAIHGDRFISTAEGNLRGHWCAKSLRRVIENLCNNAVKYGLKGSSITIALRGRPSNVQIVVSNFGPSLSEEDKAKIFNQFQRSRAAEISGKRGWGIGLTIVKGLVEAHGGAIEVESAGGETSFCIRIPRDSRLF